MSAHEVPLLAINASRGNHGGATHKNTCLLPLNSKRLTVFNLKCIAHALSIPSTSSSDESSTLVDGKLSKLGHEPHNTQVQLQSSGIIDLVDIDGMFL